MARITTSNYIIDHTLQEPSKLSDYDYDPYRPNRRFITTYLHTLKFLDPITDQEIITLRFASETCTNIISGLYRIQFSDGLSDQPSDNKFNIPQPLILSISGIYMDNSQSSSPMVISKINNIVRISGVKRDNKIIIILNQYDTDQLIGLLETDELLNMYAVKSDDREDF